MSSRAVAIAASRSAAAADSSTSTTAKRTTKTYTYKTDSSGNVSTEVHTHVDQSSDQVTNTPPVLLNTSLASPAAGFHLTGHIYKVIRWLSNLGTVTEWRICGKAI